MVHDIQQAILFYRAEAKERRRSPARQEDNGTHTTKHPTEVHSNNEMIKDIKRQYI